MPSRIVKVTLMLTAATSACTRRAPSVSPVPHAATIALASRADSVKVATIHHLLQLTNVDSQMVRSVETVLAARPGADTSDPYWVAFRDRIRATIPQLIDSTVAIYARHYEQAELDDLVRFYSSPAGRHMVSEQPAVFQETFAVGRRLGMEVAHELRDSLARAGNRHEPRVSSQTVAVSGVIVRDSEGAVSMTNDTSGPPNARRAAEAAALRYADSVISDTLKAGGDTRSLAAGMRAAQRTAAGTDSLQATPDSLRLYVGNNASLDGISIQAYDANGVPVPHFAPVLEIEDMSIARLREREIVALRPGRTVLVIRPLPVPRSDGRPEPVARIRLVVSP